MKSIFTLLSFSILSISAFAQIPNHSFENWTSGEPDGWKSSNSVVAGTVEQSNNAKTGLSAVRLNVAVLAGNINYGGAVAIGTTLSNQQEGFAYAGMPGALHGWYILNSVGGDRIHIIGHLTKQAIGIDGGAGDAIVPTTVYREFVVNFLYGNTSIDTARISLEIQPDTANSTVHLGTYGIVDSLYFGAAVTGIEELNDIAQLEPCSPNPTNNIASIKYRLTTNSHVTLELYDIAGQKVETLLTETALSPGRYKVPTDVSALPNGIYIYRLSVNGQQLTQKLVVTK